jgi:hypothetical protein
LPCLEWLFSHRCNSMVSLINVVFCVVSSSNDFYKVLPAKHSDEQIGEKREVINGGIRCTTRHARLCPR